MFNPKAENNKNIQKKIELLEIVKANQFNIPGPKVSGIYIIYNLDNDKFYIGKSTDVLARLTRHKNYLFSNSHRNKKIQNDFNKMKGPGSFIGCLIDEVDKTQLQAAERYYITYFEANIIGYNKQVPSEEEEK